MEDWKKEYDNIKVPEEMREKLEQSINRAKKEKKRMKKITLYKTFGHRVDPSKYQPDCSGSYAADPITW